MSAKVYASMPAGILHCDAVTVHEFLHAQGAEEDRRRGVFGRRIAGPIPVAGACFVKIPAELEGPEAYAAPNHGGNLPTRVFAQSVAWKGGEAVVGFEPQWLETGMVLSVGPFPIAVTFSTA